METIIFYIMIFCMGTMFGSFFTLAVYRLPLHEDITHERSFCPICNHKLSFWDMIPILSYIFLGGKCRYCKSKIRPRYLILEICSGIVFLLIAISICVTLPIAVDKLIYLVFALLYIAGLFIIAGIDKEKTQIHMGVLFYEMIIVAMYMMYLYILSDTNVYRYVIYLFFLCILLILETWYLRKKLKSNYTLQILMLSLLMIAFVGRWQFILTVMLTLLTIAIDKLLETIISKKKKNIKEKSNNIPVAYFMCVCHIVVLIVTNFMICRW